MNKLILMIVYYLRFSYNYILFGEMMRGEGRICNKDQ